MLTITQSEAISNTIFKIGEWNVAFAANAASYIYRTLLKSKGALYVYDSEPADPYAVFKRVDEPRYGFYVTYILHEGENKYSVSLCTTAVQDYFSWLPDYLYVCIKQ